jgi:molecular chaperone GrpE (heat shock protein)
MTYFPKVTTAALLSLISSSDALTSFAPIQKVSPITFVSPAFSPLQTISKSHERIRPSSFLLATEDTEGSGETEAESAGEDAATEDEPPKEDPEVTAIKEEISQLENQLKSKRRELGRIKDEIEDYTEKGYLRKCADMENLRRKRAARQSDNMEGARATTIQNFLPVLDNLRELDVMYANDEFAKCYSALRSDYESRLKGLGLSEFSVSTGEELNLSRMAAVAQEYSDDIAKGAVIREESSGIEVSGNVIRLAKCVVSLGSEAEAVKEAEEKAKAEAEAKSAETEIAEGE